MGNSVGRHRAVRASKMALPVAGAAGVIAAAGAAVIALTPTLSASPELLADANVYYAPGTKIGRPRQIYTGSTIRNYVPLEERA